MSEEEKAVFWIKGLEDDKEYLTIEQRQAIHIVLNSLSKKDKMIDEIETYCRNELAFRNRLVRSKEKITPFNNGRFDVCNEILYLLDTTEEENE